MLDRAPQAFERMEFAPGKKRLWPHIGVARKKGSIF